MSTFAIASVVVGFLCSLAIQCVLWFAAYKAGLIVTVVLLTIAALVFSIIGAHSLITSFVDKHEAEHMEAEKAAAELVERMRVDDIIAST